MERKILDVHNLTVSFIHNKKEIEALRNISFCLKEGEILGIVGESGCGKSTSMDAILRLLPSSTLIKQGKIYLQGEDLLRKTRSEMQAIRGKEISMIFQEPMKSLNPVRKIGKQILEVILTHKICPKKEAKQMVLNLLGKVGIHDAETRFHQYPHELSGGMCQRIMIAIALAAKPKILIADEPTTSLDATIQGQILSLLQNLQREEKMSLILISHDLNIVKSLCHRMLVMYAGQIVEEGFVQDVLERPRHPYTQALLEATPSFTVKNNHRLKAIQGTPPSLSPPPQGCPFQDRCPHREDICLSFPPFHSYENGQRSACWRKD